MSFTLLAWKAPAVNTEEEATALVHRYYESDDLSMFGASEQLLRFYDEMLERYPALESLADEDARIAQSPWSATPDRSDRLVELDIRWRAPDAVVDTIVDLARKYELVLYDPQGPDLHSPAGDNQPADVRGQVRSALMGGAFGLLLVGLGTLIPYRILSWPALGVGAFLIVMAAYTLVVVWKPEWEPR